MAPRRALPVLVLAVLALSAAPASADIPFTEATISTQVENWPGVYMESIGSGPMFHGVIHFDWSRLQMRRTWTFAGTTFTSDSILLGVNPGHIAARTDRYDRALHTCFYLELGGAGALHYATSQLSAGWTVETIQAGAHVGEWCAIDHRTDIGPVVAYLDPTAAAGQSTLRYASKELGFWSLRTLDTAPNASPLGWPAIATNKTNATHVAWVNGATHTIRYCTGPATAIEEVAPDTDVSMIALAVDRSGSPHVAYVKAGALLVADRVDGTWQSHEVLPATWQVYAIAFTYATDTQPYVVFTTADAKPLQLATPLFGAWRVQSIGTVPASSHAGVPAIAAGSGIDPRMHVCTAWVANGLEVGWDDPNAIAFTRAHLVACPDSDAVSTVGLWRTTRVPVSSAPVTLDFLNGAVWDSTSACGGPLTYAYGTTGADGVATIRFKSSGSVTGGIRVRYGGSTGTVVEPSVPLAGVDADGNGVVTMLDHDLLVSRYGTSDPRSDLDFDGVVGPADRDSLLAHLGHGCVTVGVPSTPPPVREPTPALRVGPNPMRGVTHVRLEAASTGRLRVEVLDLAGRLVRVLHDEAADEGRRTWDWNGCDEGGRRVASGLYVIRVGCGGQRVTGRVLVLN